MAKKTRKQKQRAPARRVQSPGAAPRPGTPTASAPTRMAQPLPASVMPAPGSGGAVESEPDDIAVTTGAAAADDAYAAADGSSRRRVQRINPAAQPRQTSRTVSTAAMFLPLESDDAAIPFDRVPYVPQDLRRVAIMASLMIVLILIAAFVVTRINP